MIRFHANGIYNAPRTHVDCPILKQPVAGSYISLLRTVLITGYGLRSVQSIDIDANGIATVGCTNHGVLMPLIVMSLTGAIDTTYNRDWRVTKIVDSNTLQMDMTEGLLRSTTVLGASLTIKVAPHSWAERFTDNTNNISVFQSTSLDGINPYLKIIDNVTTSYAYATVKMVESLDGIGVNEVNVCPKTQALYWVRDSYDNGKQYSDPNNVGWMLFVSDKLFYLVVHTQYTSYYNGNVLYAFGELNKFLDSDIGNCVIIGTKTNDVTILGTLYDFSLNDNRATILRPINGNLLTTDTTLKIHTPLLVASPLGRGNLDTKQKDFVYHDTLYWTSSDDLSYVRGIIPGLGIFVNAISSPIHGTLLNLNNVNYMLLAIASNINNESGGHLMINLDSWA